MMSPLPQPAPTAEQLDLLRATGALLEGHFLLSSGRHAARYFQAMRLLERPRLADAIAREVAARLAVRGVTATLAPALGGIVWGHAVARALAAAGPDEPRALFAERVEGALRLRRGFTLGPDDVVLLCEDVVTTGGTVVELAALAEAAGARIAAVAAVADRSGGDHALRWPLAAWIALEAPSWDAAACPACRAGSVPVKPGSRGAS